MKAMILDAPGGLDRLRLVDRPDPGVPGPGMIRVRLHATSLNYHDYGIVSGNMPTQDGRVPMSDGAGIVEAIGEGVTDFDIGDAVVSCFFPGWHEGPARVGDFATVPGDGIDGYAREAVIAPATAFTRTPKGYDHAEAATITTAGLTAWRRDSGVGDIFEGMSKFMPPPPEGAGSPFQWGQEAYVEEMLGDAFDLEFEELDTRHDDEDPAEMWELFRSSYGPRTGWPRSRSRWRSWRTRSPSRSACPGARWCFAY